MPSRYNQANVPLLVPYRPETVGHCTPHLAKRTTTRKLYPLIFKQKKTSGQEYLDITPQAAKLMGPRGESNEPIFKNVYTPSNTNQVIKRWISNAGICKNITFHCARHSFAVMMLDLETDIYTVSKLLGHRDLSTTQIYAKILDKNKQAAVSRIPDLLK